MSLVSRSRLAYFPGCGRLAALLILASRMTGLCDLTSVTWRGDSYSDFDVLLTGVGGSPLPFGGTTNGCGFTGTLTSPSGLWSLYTINYLTLPGMPSAPTDFGVYNHGAMTFNGTIPASDNPPSSYEGYNTSTIFTQGYYDIVPEQPSVRDGASWNMGFLHDEVNWRGSSSWVVSATDPSNPSGWTWEAEYAGSGPSLAPIPEPSSLSLLGLGLCGSLLFARKR